MSRLSGHSATSSVCLVLSGRPGVKIIFRVGLVLLKCMLGSQDKLKTCQGQYETMELLKTIDTRYMLEGFLVREVVMRNHHSQPDF